MIEAVLPKDKLPAPLLTLWCEPGGDCRLELVLIRVRLKAAELTRALEPALF